jgi:peptidoglycan/xylan/chitin deacetylase (PgdA/CDA1 family)
MKWILGLLVLALPSLAAQAPTIADREMAITVDDLPGVSAEDRSLAHLERVTKGILDAFTQHKVPAIGFVNENKLELEGAPDPARIALLRQWVTAGFELGNHTYSHPDLHLVALEAFTADVVRGELVTRELMKTADKPLRYFRHPFLHTGRSAETRRALDAFLAGRGYRVAPVTIDNADYIFARAYDQRVAAGDAAEADRVLITYIDYMTRVVEYYEQQSQALLGRPMRHILLTHANALNARAFPRWLPMLERRGYRFISLDRALEDEAYTTQRDEFFGPSGITWLHRWAITDGKRGAFFAGEPEVPAWVQHASTPGPP